MTRIAAVAAVAVAGLLAVGGALLSVLLAQGTPVNELVILLVIACYTAVAVVIGIARPGHPVGRLMLTGTAVWGVGEGLLGLAVDALSRDRTTLAGWLGMLGSLRGLGWLLLVVGLPLIFPDGRTPWGGRRPLVLLAGAVGMFVLGSVLAPVPLDYRLTDVDNPAGLPAGAKVVADLLALGGLALVAVSLAVAVAGLVHRWRVGGDLLRQQLLWFTAAFAVPLLLIPFVPTTFVEPWMFAVVTMPAPVAVAVALFQRRLYDVQLVVNRTVTYVTLSVTVAGLYAVTVGGVGALLHERGAPWLPWLAAGVVAVTFAPLRNALQQAVNRLTYGQWSQPADVLATTGRRLSDAADVPVLLRSLADELARGLGLPYVEITDAHGRTLATHGASPPTYDETPLTAYGRTVGTLRHSNVRLRSADRRLLEDLAAQLGGVVHAAGLVADLRAARERLVQAREEERRRLRRDLHDGLGPALAGLTLQVDTVRNRLAAGRVADTDLVRLRDGVAATVLDVRRIVEGLRPAALDDPGLGGALPQLAHRVEDECGIRMEVSVPAALPRVPAAVEVAAYRIAQEALGNVARHSGARHARLALAVDGSALWLSVCDDGVGEVHPRPGGLGLTTMHERATEVGGRLCVDSTRRGTTVEAWLPCTDVVPS